MDSVHAELIEELLVQVAAFSKRPSLSFAAASPSVRIAVERTAKSNNERIVVQLKPIPSSSSTPVIQRHIIYNDIYDRPSRCLPPPLWWLLRDANKDVPVALKLPAFASLQSSDDEEDKSIKIAPLKEWGPSFINGMESYLNLPSLRSLTIRSGGLRDLRWLPHCSNLEALDLHHAFDWAHLSDSCDYSYIAALPHLGVLKMTGSVPSTLDWIGQCQSITELSLVAVQSISNTKSFDFSGIAQLQQLSTLKISKCKIPCVAWLSGCKALTTLCCSDCPFPPINELPNLTHVELKSTHGNLSRGDVDYFDYTPKIVKIHVEGANLDSIKWLIECPSVEDLSLKMCESINDFDILGRLTWIKSLDISYTHVSNIDWIVGCISLEELDICNCDNIRDFSPIGHLDALKALYMENSLPQSVAWLSNCPVFQHLEIGSFEYPLLDFASFSALKTVRKLVLTFCEAKPLDMEVFAACTLLEELDLSGTESVVNLEALAKLPRLRSLNLENTDITSVACLAACPRLMELKVTKENIEDLYCIDQRLL